MYSMSKSSVLRLLTLAVLVTTILVGVTCGVSALSDDGFGDAAKTVQALGTLAAIIAGGVFALYKLQVFRDFQPHLTITHEISHRPIGESYVHLDVIATLRNSSRTHVEVREALYVLQLISPTSDEDIDLLYAEAFGRENLENVQWPILEEGSSIWAEGDFIVEPGETHQETIEFIAKSDVKSVLIYTYFHNFKHSDGSLSAEGWYANTVYDIMEEDEALVLDGGT